MKPAHLPIFALKLILILSIIAAIQACTSPRKQKTKEQGPATENLRYHYENNIDPASISYWKGLRSEEKPGQAFLTHFEPPYPGGAYNSDVLVNRDNLMFFANRRGVMLFNGQNWENISLPAFPYQLELDTALNRVYVGGDNAFGFIGQNARGEFHYKSLADSGFSGTGIIRNIVLNEDTAWFQSRQTVFRYQTTTQELTKLDAAYPKITGLFLNQNRLWLSIDSLGLFPPPPNHFHPLGKTIADTTQLAANPFGPIRYKDDSLSFAGQELLFSLRYDSTRTLLATQGAGVFLFDGKALKPYQYDAQTYTANSVLTCGTRLTEKIYAFGTLTGGAVVIEKATGKTLSVLNYQTGLPDDEIFAIGRDLQNGLWMSHEEGFSRADFSLPLVEYTQSPGLEGNLVAVSQYNNKLYVASSEGVFFLDRVKNYKEIERLVKVRKEEKKTPTETQEEESGLRKVWNTIFQREEEAQQQAADDTTATQGQDKQEDEKGGWFRRLFNRDKTEGTEKAADTSQTPTPAQGTAPAPQNTAAPQKKETAGYTLTKEKIYALESISNLFRAVPDLEAKVQEMLVSGDYLFAATNKGLYIVQDEQVKKYLDLGYLHDISPSPHADTLWAAGEKGLFRISPGAAGWTAQAYPRPGEPPLLAVLPDEGHKLWLASSTTLSQVQWLEGQNLEVLASYSFPASYNEEVLLHQKSPDSLLVISSEAYFLDKQRSLIRPLDSLAGLPVKAINNFQAYGENLWVQARGRWICLAGCPQAYESTKYIRLISNINFVASETAGDIWLIADKSRIYKIDNTIARNVPAYPLSINFSKLESPGIGLLPRQQIQLDYKDNALYARLMSPYYLRSEAIKYRYLLHGIDDTWSEWRSDTRLEFPFLPVGKYTLEVQSKNVFNQLSYTQSVRFSVQPPIWQRWWFILLVVVLLLGLSGLIIYWREQNLRKANRLLEAKVEERTREIQEKQNEITASINYGKRIQEAMLAPTELKHNAVHEHFVFYLPRDIVSGDFYWHTRKGSKSVYAAVDCTGHGVPGAFLSMLGMAYLNEIVNIRNILAPKDILETLRTEIINSLRQGEGGSKSQDGMDLALIVIDDDKKEMKFAGAYNPLILIRGGETLKYKGNRMPIGVHPGKQLPFKEETIPLQSGDQIYIFSDGFQDQTGGENARKYLSGRFRKYLLAISGMPAKAQATALENEFFSWKGEHEQVDDVLVIGVKID